jgi:hypothetical protein
MERSHLPSKTCLVAAVRVVAAGFLQQRLEKTSGIKVISGK